MPPPILPSQDLLGETDTKSLVFPKAFPTKYAPASFSQRMMKVPRMMILEYSCVFIKRNVAKKGMRIYPKVDKVIGNIEVRDFFLITKYSAPKVKNVTAKAEKSKGAESNDKSDELTNAAIPIPAPRRYVLVLLVFAVA